MRWGWLAVVLFLTACGGSDDATKAEPSTSSEGASTSVCDLLDAGDREALAGRAVPHDVSGRSLQPGEIPQLCQFSDEEFLNDAGTIIGYEAKKATSWAKAQSVEPPIYPAVRDSKLFRAAAKEAVGSESALKSVDDAGACRFWDVYRTKGGWESVAEAKIVGFEASEGFSASRPEVRVELCKDGVFTSVAILSDELAGPVSDDVARRVLRALAAISRRAPTVESSLD